MPDVKGGWLRLIKSGVKIAAIRSLAATRSELWMPIGHASILMYHGVLPAGQVAHEWSHVTIDDFVTQMDFIHRHYRPISLDSLASYLNEKKPLPPRAVVVTFDDGLRNNAEVAAPILRSRGIPATIFCVSSFIGSDRLLWIDRIVLYQRILAESEPEKWREVLAVLKDEFGVDTGGDPLSLVQVMKDTPFDTKERVMAWMRSSLGDWDDRSEAAPFLPMSVEQVRELDADPLFTIGAHTLSHEIISQCNPEEARRQIVQGKTDLEALLGHPVDHFAFPNGLPANISEEGHRLVAKAGFASSSTTCYGNVVHHHNPLELPRLGVGNEPISFQLMRLGLSGLYPALKAFVQRFRSGASHRDD